MSRGAWNVRKAYFEWLYYQAFEVLDVESPLSFSVVCAHLHSVQFNDRVPNDDNRTAMGEELRDEFISTLSRIPIEDYAEMQDLGKCSLLEMMIALSRRAEYNSSISSPDWVKIFIENLGLTKYADSRWVPRDDLKISRILRTMNERTYSESGKGGLFPLEHPEKDQRDVELWYQLSAYIIENHM
jgi:hypothetical protein